MPQKSRPVINYRTALVKLQLLINVRYRVAPLFRRVHPV